MRDEAPNAFLNGYADVVPSQNHLRVLRHLRHIEPRCGVCGYLRFIGLVTHTEDQS
ncbi:MAG TPA: hypothetical protein VFU01_10480 [Gemmatimonadaceae bacterium]|nr:hypothetical protein [Gemmatimonadaceae bacterium]